jgi:hypothetical protein
MEQEILMVKIHNGLKDKKTPYEATRKHWKVNTARHPFIKYVVGFNKKEVTGVFEPSSWHIVNEGSEKGRSYFEGNEANEEIHSQIKASSELLLKKFGTGSAIAYAYLADLKS